MTIWILALAFLILIAWSAFRRLGHWLALTDPLEPASCILILGGRLPFRATEAAAIYHQAFAPEIWVSQYPLDPETAALAEMGIQMTPSHEYNLRILEKCGVPRGAVVLMDRPSIDTREELEIVSRALRDRHPGGAIILVTSKCRARRVKTIWKIYTGTSHKAIVRSPREDAFAPDRWFTNTRDLGEVAYECFGLLNLWTGFRIRKRL